MFVYFRSLTMTVLRGRPQTNSLSLCCFYVCFVLSFLASFLMPEVPIPQSWSTPSSVQKTLKKKVQDRGYSKTKCGNTMGQFNAKCYTIIDLEKAYFPSTLLSSVTTEMSLPLAVWSEQCLLSCLSVALCLVYSLLFIFELYRAKLPQHCCVALTESCILYGFIRINQYLIYLYAFIIHASFTGQL